MRMRVVWAGAFAAAVVAIVPSTTMAQVFAGDTAPGAVRTHNFTLPPGAQFVRVRLTAEQMELRVTSSQPTWSSCTQHTAGGVANCVLGTAPEGVAVSVQIQVRDTRTCNFFTCPFTPNQPYEARVTWVTPPPPPDPDPDPEDPVCECPAGPMGPSGPPGPAGPTGSDYSGLLPSEMRYVSVPWSAFHTRSGIGAVLPESVELPGSGSPYIGNAPVQLPDGALIREVSCAMEAPGQVPAWSSQVALYRMGWETPGSGEMLVGVGMGAGFPMPWFFSTEEMSASIPVDGASRYVLWADLRTNGFGPRARFHGCRVGYVFED